MNQPGEHTNALRAGALPTWSGRKPVKENGVKAEIWPPPPYLLRRSKRVKIQPGRAPVARKGLVPVLSQGIGKNERKHFEGSGSFQDL